MLFVALVYRKLQDIYLFHFILLFASRETELPSGKFRFTGRNMILQSMLNVHSNSEVMSHEAP